MVDKWATFARVFHIKTISFERLMKAMLLFISDIAHEMFVYSKAQMCSMTYLMENRKKFWNIFLTHSKQRTLCFNKRMDRQEIMLK